MDINPINPKVVKKIQEKDYGRLNTRTGEKGKSEQNEGITSQKPEVKTRIISESQIKDVVEKANKRLTLANTKYELQYNSEKNKLTVRVVNKETQEEVGEIPSENMEKLYDNVLEVTGLIIDEKI